MNGTKQHTQQSNHPDNSDWKKQEFYSIDELLKWYHGCTKHFTAKVNVLIASSDTSDTIADIIAHFLSNESRVICRDLGFVSSDKDDEDGHADDEDADCDEQEAIYEANIMELEAEVEYAKNKAELYKASFEALIEKAAFLMVYQKHLEEENVELHKQLTELLYGDQESGE